MRPLTTSRVGRDFDFWRFLAGGITGSTYAHSLSVRSLQPATVIAGAGFVAPHRRPAQTIRAAFLKITRDSSSRTG